MDDEHIDRMVAVLKAMADETRLRILGVLAERPHTGKELSVRLGLTPPTISHHLRKLEAVDLIRSVAEAQRQWHSLNTDALRA
ncbi:MAG: metalloregulator ArsR/SmtB family transcription factor, partial [Chloroflexota bacterium]|nr:metalloregulator ArsR/SmtB family transcription factor [Chloroflexota bacterium]